MCYCFNGCLPVIHSSSPFQKRNFAEFFWLLLLLLDYALILRVYSSISLSFFLSVPERLIPCLYFEAELKHAPCRVKQIGFINMATREKMYCDIHDGHLQLPKTSSPATFEQESFRIPDVVGCAVVLTTGQIMFTLDGVPTGQFYDFPTTIDRLFPYISCTRIRCNYGQRSFLFEDANSKESFSWSGSLLFDCLQSITAGDLH